MKIKTKKMSMEEVLKLPKMVHKDPIKPNLAMRKLMQLVSKGELAKTHFTHQEFGMEKLGKEEPCLILMNHSSFIDLKMAAILFKDRPFQIVCTSDGFVGKENLMRQMGCIPTNKFVTDISLVKDMLYATQKNRCSVLMFPEASYSFDGTATPLPASIGKCIKMLKVPVIMVRTYGAFQRDPLYNNLQLRDVAVSADVIYLLGKEDIEKKTAKEINSIVKEQFSFDHFAWQKEKKISVTEAFRADHLNRVLYKCPACQTEGKMVGKGIYLTCQACQKKYELTEFGEMKALQGRTEISHIPSWYQWERECVKKEIEAGTYSLSVDVDICVLTDLKCLYEVGSGHLTHGVNGFHLTGCDGLIDFTQENKAAYSLYADYFWYEKGDVICIGNNQILYYCFPKEAGDFVAKTRLATEELFRQS